MYRPEMFRGEDEGVEVVPQHRSPSSSVFSFRKLVGHELFDCKSVCLITNRKVNIAIISMIILARRSFSLRKEKWILSTKRNYH
jgi:hypothetical protein